MISSGIVIHWSNSVEYISINMDALNEDIQIDSTIEYWTEGKVWTNYKVIPNFRWLDKESLEINLEYDQNLNTHIEPDDASWGKSTIIINIGSDKGVATWSDSNDRDNNGDVSWEKIDKGLYKEEAKIHSSKLKRDQAAFRQMLLASDVCCAITGEETKEVLDAAHVIPSKDGGAEVRENGLLLRTDLHRLYDSGNFQILPNGQIVIKEASEMSSNYLKMLNNKKIPLKIANRINKALEILLVSQA